MKLDCVIENTNMPSLYEVPLALEEEGLAEQVIKRLKIQCKEKDMHDWEDMVQRSKKLSNRTQIALVGKYTYVTEISPFW